MGEAAPSGKWTVLDPNAGRIGGRTVAIYQFSDSLELDTWSALDSRETLVHFVEDVVQHSGATISIKKVQDWSASVAESLENMVRSDVVNGVDVRVTGVTIYVQGRAPIPNIPNNPMEFMGLQAFWNFEPPDVPVDPGGGSPPEQGGGDPPEQGGGNPSGGEGGGGSGDQPSGGGDPDGGGGDDLPEDGEGSSSGWVDYCDENYPKSEDDPTHCPDDEGGGSSSSDIYGGCLPFPIVWSVDSQGVMNEPYRPVMIVCNIVVRNVMH
jgi:hypothetical protein